MIWLWVLSLLVLIASLIFVYRILSTSKELFSIDSAKGSAPNRKSALPGSKKSVFELNEKIRSLEETTRYYQTLFNDFKEQLKVLESKREIKTTVEADDFQKEQAYEEDWKELYFEENEKKEALENELDSTSQRLEQAENQLQEFQHCGQNMAILQVELQNRSLEIEALKSQIEELMRQLNAKSMYEEEMEKMLHQHKQLLQEQQVLKHENSRLRAANEDLQGQLSNLSGKVEIQRKMVCVNTEFESAMSLFNTEYGNNKRRVEEMVSQNRMFRN